MNRDINIFLLTGDKFMSELHLKQPLFTNSAYGQFTKHRETIKKFTEAGNLKQLYRNKLDKACFLLMIQHILIVKIYQKEILQIRF